MLQRSNLFTISLDVQGEWFRFHHLFQEILNKQLEQQREPSEIAALHLRASDWFESEGLITESITHALAAGEPDRAADIVLGQRYDLLNSDRWYFTEKLLLQLPVEIRQSNAGLLLMQAWIAYWRWELEKMMALVERAEALLDDETEGSASLRGELDFFNGQVAYWTGETEKSRKLLDGALSGLGGVGGIVEGNVEIMLGLARRINGEGEMAIQALENRVRTAGSDESAFISQVLAALVFVHLTTGDLAAAHVCSRQITTHAQRAGMSNTVAWAQYFHAYAHFQAQDLQRGDRRLQRDGPASIRPGTEGSRRRIDRARHRLPALGGYEERREDCGVTDELGRRGWCPRTPRGGDVMPCSSRCAARGTRDGGGLGGNDSRAAGAFRSLHVAGGFVDHQGEGSGGAWFATEPETAPRSCWTPSENEVKRGDSIATPSKPQF